LSFSGSSLTLSSQNCNENEFALWTIVPIEKSGVSLLGEVDKWVAISEARFGMMTYIDSKEQMEVEIYGVANEEVSIGFVGSAGEVSTVRCIFSSAESVTSTTEEYLTMTVSSTGTCVH
jgi:hypothetical protein